MGREGRMLYSRGEGGGGVYIEGKDLKTSEVNQAKWWYEEKKSSEIGFFSNEAVNAALNHGLSLDGHLVPLTRYYTLKANIIQVTIRGLPCFSKEETKEAIQEAFAPHGLAQEVQYHYY